MQNFEESCITKEDCQYLMSCFNFKNLRLWMTIFEIPRGVEVNKGLKAKVI